MLPLNKVRPWILIPALVVVSVAMGWFSAQHVDLMENDHLEEMNQQLDGRVTDLQSQLKEYDVKCAVGAVVIITLEDPNFMRGWVGQQKICARDWRISNAVGPRIGPNPEMKPWYPPLVPGSTGTNYLR